MTTFRSVMTASTAALALATMIATSIATAAPLSFQPLLLLNGWKTYGSDVRAPKVAIDQEGVVHFLGAMKLTSGSINLAFNLPPQFRPNKTVYVVTNLCNSAPGRLIIHSDGDAVVDSFGSFDDAECFTSLEGVSFPKP